MILQTAPQGPQIGEVIAGVSLLVTIFAIVFKIGERYANFRRSHLQMEEAHEMLHRDIAAIRSSIDGDRMGRIENCPVCGNNIEIENRDDDNE